MCPRIIVLKGTVFTYTHTRCPALGYLAMSGNIFDCLKWVEVLLTSRGYKSWIMLLRKKNHSAPNASNVKVKKLCSRVSVGLTAFSLVMIGAIKLFWKHSDIRETSKPIGYVPAFVQICSNKHTAHWISQRGNKW